MLTVHGLRKRGFRVTVHHNRFISPEFGGKLRGKKDLVNVSMPDVTPKMFHPRGGETIVQLEFPYKKNGGDVTVITKAHCLLEDNYDRQAGVATALEYAENAVAEIVNPQMLTKSLVA